MARIVCFADSVALLGYVQHGLSGSEHTLFHHSSSRLSIDMRQSIRKYMPDLVLLELSHTLDNPHLYFFLRSDMATRHIPVIVISASAQVELHALALSADGFLHAPFSADQLEQILDRLLPLRAESVGAPRVEQPPRAEQVSRPAEAYGMGMFSSALT